MENLISNDVLSVIFNRLRAKDNIKMGKISSLLKPDAIFKILINARYKQERQIELSDIEKNVKFESGEMICMYVAEKWNLIKANFSSSKLPYPEIANQSKKEIEKQLEKKKNYSINRFIA